MSIMFLFVIQGFDNSCDKKRKKAKKSEKLLNATMADEIPNGPSKGINGVQKSKNAEKIKSGKHKKLTKDSVVNAGTVCSPEAEHPVRKKKKSVAKAVVNGHKMKSKTISDVADTVEHHPNKSFTVHAKDHLNESSTQQSETHTNDDLTSSVVKKRRKRKNKDSEEGCVNSQDNAQDVDTQHGKKLKLDNESPSDKTVINNSSVQSGAFENYRISQTMANNLRCM